MFPSTSLRHFKTLFRSILVWTVISVGTATIARAQLTFTVDKFETKNLTVTINAGSLLTTNGSSEVGSLYLVNADDTFINWVNYQNGTSTGAQTYNALGYNYSLAGSDALGDYIIFSWYGDLSAVGDLNSGLTFTYAGDDLFNTANISNFELIWGSPAGGYTTQSIGTAVTGGGSAVPEPGTYALFLGAVVLGWVTIARRRRV